MQLIQTLNQKWDQWLTAPESNAVGTMGLFRILYAWSYLWHLSFNYSDVLQYLPNQYYDSKTLITDVLPTHLGMPMLGWVESLLVMGLVWLMVGFRVRLATALVLILGIFLEANISVIYMTKSTVFLVCYIPFFMLITNHWGHTYSIDSILSDRKRHIKIDPSSSDGNYFIVPRVILIILSVLFLFSAIFKLQGTWLTFPDLILDLMIMKNIQSAVLGLPINPFLPLIASVPLIYYGIHLFTLMFEGGFWLGIFSRKIRYVFIATALLFHAFNAIWLVVTFTPILIVYCLFINWQGIRERIFPKPILIFQKIPSTYLQMGTIFLAIIIGLFWNTEVGIRSIINLGGMINWHTIWYPILPLSCIWLIISLVNLFPSKKSRLEYLKN